MFSVHVIGYFYYTGWNVQIILEKEKKIKKYEARAIKIMEAQRFQLLSDEDLERLCDKYHNKNTVVSDTKLGLKIYIGQSFREIWD